MSLKWIAAVAAALLASFYALQDVLAPVITAHPKYAAAVAGAVGFLAWLKDSPLFKTGVKTGVTPPAVKP